MIRLIVFVALLLVPFQQSQPQASLPCAPAQHETKDESFTKESAWLYAGAIDDRERVGLVLRIAADGTMTGVYFSVTDLKDYRVEGCLGAGRTVLFNILGASGDVTARVSGQFAVVDPYGAFNGEKLN